MILFATSFDGKGRGHDLQGDEVARLLKDRQLAWVHLDATHAGTRGWLETTIDYLDPLILDALLAGETRPRTIAYDKGVLLILRGVNLNENADPEDMVSLRMWIDPHRIITMQRRNLKAVQDIHQKITDGSGPKNAGDFLADITARLFERMEPVLTSLNERIDDIEEEILDEPDISERGEITDLRKKAIILRRYIMPQRDVIMGLRNVDMGWVEEKHRRKLQESQERLTRYLEDLDMIRERAQIVKDELSNMLSDRLNKNMYVLSVIAAIFLPLGFLTGLLGINVGGIPGADNPWSFYIFCGILGGIVLAQIVLFKKMKWF